MFGFGTTEKRLVGMTSSNGHDSVKSRSRLPYGQAGPQEHCGPTVVKHQTQHEVAVS